MYRLGRTVITVVGYDDSIISSCVLARVEAGAKDLIVPHVAASLLLIELGDLVFWNTRHHSS
jgi:hypothetical protein